MFTSALLKADTISSQSRRYVAGHGRDDTVAHRRTELATCLGKPLRLVSFNEPYLQRDSKHNLNAIAAEFDADIIDEDHPSYWGDYEDAVWPFLSD